LYFSVFEIAMVPPQQAADQGGAFPGGLGKRFNSFDAPSSE
jgi:hypothetical protein